MHLVKLSLMGTEFRSYIVVVTRNAEEVEKVVREKRGDNTYSFQQD